MPSASLALQQAIHAALSADALLASQLGGAKVFDDVPQGTALPYVVLTQSTATDWSTGTERGTEHIVTLIVWSRDAGRKASHEILDRIRELLDDQPLALDSHRLVNIRCEFCDTRRGADEDTYRGLIRLRAVTEPT